MIYAEKLRRVRHFSVGVMAGGNNIAACKTRSLIPSCILVMATYKATMLFPPDAPTATTYCLPDSRLTVLLLRFWGVHAAHLHGWELIRDELGQ